MNFLGLILATFCFCYVGLMLFALLFANKMIFPAPPASYGPKHKTLQLSLKNGGTIHAVYMPAENARYTILYSHGNGEDIGHMQPIIESFNQRGFNVFIYDYPGYGLSEGTPSEAGCYAAINAAYAYLHSELKIPQDTIILYGRSLGGGPSVDLASRETVAGLILEATFTSTFRVITKIKIVPWDKFDSIAKLDSIQCPLLVFHGKLDQTVPFAHGQKLYAAGPTKKHKLWLDNAHHNNIMEVAGERYWQSIDALVADIDSN